jgi:DNA-binding transcriptional LysR family regulator
MSRSQLVARQLQDTALRYFLEVVRCGSISEASARLNVAGSSISRHITQLESLLGTPLFERHRRGMIPNAAGELLAAHAQKASHEAERAVYDIEALQDMQRGRVKIASSEGFALEFLPHLIAEFVKVHPGIQFYLGVHAPVETTRRIQTGDADIGITMSRTPQPGVNVAYLQPSPVTAVMRHGHPLSKFESLTLAQLQGYPLALPEASTTVRQLFDIAVGRQRLPLEAALTCNYTSSLIGFLRHHDGITIAGELTVRNQVNRKELACVPLSDAGLELRNIEVQTMEGRTLSRAAQAFLEYMVRELGKDG